MLDYVQSDLSVSDELKAKFSNFPSFSKNFDVTGNDIGRYMKTYPEDGTTMSKNKVSRQAKSSLYIWKHCHVNLLSNPT